MTTKLLMCVKDGKSSIKLSVTYKYIPRDLKRKTLKIGKKKAEEEENQGNTFYDTCGYKINSLEKVLFTTSFVPYFKKEK